MRAEAIITYIITTFLLSLLITNALLMQRHTPHILRRSISYVLLFSYFVVASVLIVFTKCGLLADGWVWLLGSSLWYALSLGVSSSIPYDGT